MRDGYMNIFTVRLKIHFANPKRDFPRQNVRDKHLLNRYVKHLKIEFALRTQRLGRAITPISSGPRDTLSLSLSLEGERGRRTMFVAGLGSRQHISTRHNFPLSVKSNNNTRNQTQAN